MIGSKIVKGLSFLFWLVLLCWATLGAIVNASQGNLDLFLGFSLFAFASFIGLLTIILK